MTNIVRVQLKTTNCFLKNIDKPRNSIGIMDKLYIEVEGLNGAFYEVRHS